MKNCLLLLLFYSLTYGLTAQIVNIEDKRAVEADTNGWFGTVDLGFSLVKNTTEIFTVTGRTQLEFQKNQHYLLNVLNYNFVKAEGNDFINDGFAHLRYNYDFNKKWTYEAFGQAQYNEKINLRFRGLVGTGMRYLLIDLNNYRFYWAMAYMFEYNEETAPEVFFRDHRMSTYLSGKLPLTKSVTLSGTTYYQPVLTNFNDWRLSSRTVLVFTISTKLRFTSSFNLTYDSRVPVGTPNLIYSLANGLRWQF